MADFVQESRFTQRTAATEEALIEYADSPSKCSVEAANLFNMLRSHYLTIVRQNTDDNTRAPLPDREAWIEIAIVVAAALEVFPHRLACGLHLDLVEQVLGPDIVLWGCQIFCKPAGDGMEVPMHQDGQYWPIRPLANCTVWVAIDESTEENGCLRVVPGSHSALQIFEHEHDMRDGLVLRDKVRSQFIETEPVDVELQPGQMSMHDIHLIHGSNANRSDKRRAGIAIRYMPATSLFDRSIITHR